MIVAVAPGVQANEARLFKAGGEAEMFLSTLAEMMIATDMCGTGDRRDLQRVVTAVDRRFRFCVGRDGSWSRLLGDFAAAEKQSLAQGSSRSFGSFAVEAFLRTRGAEAQAKGAQAFCAKFPWQMALVPAAATQQAKADYMKAYPAATLDEALAFAGYILKLGTDAAWVESPCDEDFWPPFPGNK